MTRRPITAAELRAAADALDAIEVTIRAMAAAGRPATDIARAIGHNLPWALRHMRAMGLPVGQPSRPSKYAQRIEAIRDDLRNGLSVTAVSAKYGMARQTLFYVAARHGLPIGSP